MVHKVMLHAQNLRDSGHDVIGKNPGKSFDVLKKMDLKLYPAVQKHQFWLISS